MSGTPLLVFFTSRRSGPARRMESLLAHIARKERDTLRVKKVDVDERPELAERFRIAEVPSLALVKGKRVVARLEGRSTAPKIESMLERARRGARPSSDSSRAITARPKSAARLPSITRWSNVTETLPMRRTTISPSRTTGRSAIR